MSKRRPIYVGVVAILLGSAITAPALASPSLAQMLEAALSRNPGIELADAERSIGDALRRKSEQPFAGDPAANVKYQSDALGSDHGYREWEGGIEMPLWLPGQADSYAREATRTDQVSDVLRSAKRLEIAGEVRDRLWSAEIARGEAVQAEAGVTAAKELYADVQRRVDAGELPRTDLLLAEKAVLEREEIALLAQTRFEQAQQSFSYYTGLDLPSNPREETPHREKTLNPEHPLLLLSRGRVDQARARRERVNAERHAGPSLWLGGKTTKAVAGSEYESSVGVEISMPFGTGAHAAPALAEAESSLTQAQVDDAGARRDLEDRLAEALFDLARTEAAIEQAGKRNRLADESLKLNKRAFSLGETDLIHLLQAQADALAARHDLEIRRLERAHAIARLNQAQGVIPR